MADRAEESALAGFGSGLVRNETCGMFVLIVIPSEVERSADRIVLRSRGTLCSMHGRPNARERALANGEETALITRRNLRWQDLAADWYPAETQGPSTAVLVH
jgi:hypothetical protein